MLYNATNKVNIPTNASALETTKATGMAGQMDEIEWKWKWKWIECMK